MNELINEEAVCRTAPATPGLLNIVPILETVYKQKWLHHVLEQTVAEGKVATTH